MSLQAIHHFRKTSQRLYGFCCNACISNGLKGPTCGINGYTLIQLIPLQSLQYLFYQKTLK